LVSDVGCGSPEREAGNSVLWSWYKFVEFMCWPDGGVSEECVEVKGHWVLNDSFVPRVFMLCVAWNSAKSSGAFRSLSSTHESCAGEYPFHLTRYCFFFHHP